MYSPALGFTRVNLERRPALLLGVGEGKPRRRSRRRSVAMIDASNLYVTRTELHELLAQAYGQAGMPGQRGDALPCCRQVMGERRRNVPRAPRLGPALARQISKGVRVVDLVIPSGAAERRSRGICCDVPVASYEVRIVDPSTR
jgi:hypothetical protein